MNEKTRETVWRDTMDIDKQILMESGTNELEILVFTITEEQYGINIAKVREVITIPNLVKPPLAHPFIQGVFNLREKIVPVINLRRVLGYEGEECQTTERVIITEFHKLWFGFIVDTVSNIYRISWEDIEPPSDEYNSDLLTGIAHIQEKLVLMLDVERITQSISTNIAALEEKTTDSEIIDRRASKKIVVAEDSNTIRNIIYNTLINGGYKQLEICRNGEEAWEKIQNDPTIDLIITDIEMPRLDGLRLTKLVKSDEKYKHIPVIIFSSIISEDNKNKGEAVGANEQISKPELKLLVEMADKYLIAA